MYTAKTVRTRRPTRDGVECGAADRAPSAPVLSISTVAFVLMVYGLIAAVTVAYQLTQAALS